MDTCDALIAGGGPAGSSCAWRLRQAGLDVLIMDAATFPRDKVCAGWITPPVVDDLRVDMEEYRQGRTLQPITGFRTGMIGAREDLETKYDRPVSFGIRRCEFDQYLLRRSAARLSLGTPVSHIRRDGRGWIVNEAVRTPVLVGAGGHFCPVARWLNGPTLDPTKRPIVVAQEAEVAIDSLDAAECAIAPEEPELYFCEDLKGYGWCFLKQRYLNVGFGRQDRHALPSATAEFVAFLKARRKIPSSASWRWHGHAYGLYQSSGRSVTAPGLVLVGDAGGLAYPQSGEGIRPAVESGLLAASVLIDANGDYTDEKLQPYRERLRKRFSTSVASDALSRLVPTRLTTAAAAWLLESSWFVRHVVLNRWFLHADLPALALS